MREMQRVVITGLGALTPIGNTVADFWQNLLAGQSGAAPISKFDTTHFKTKFACELKGLALTDFFDAKEIRKNDPFTLYALLVSRQAMEDAGFTSLSEEEKNRFGVIWASGNGGIYTFQEEMKAYAQGSGVPRFSPFFIPKILSDTPSGAISLQHELRGINHTTVSACASATSAIMDAFNYIRWGMAERMLTGGSEAPITEAAIGGFNALRALSTRNESPETASRPFDADRDGFVMGEGAGALVLESLESAQKRGAKIYAEVVGCGMSADAYHATATHPEGLGARLAMEMALKDAGIQPADINHINLHATSTPVGDLSEIKALQHVFGAHLPNVQLSATKSMTGHLLGAAGAIEGIAAALSTYYDQVPPTINTQTPDPALPEGIQLTLGKPVSRPLRYAMSNTFGFGGHNAIAILRKWSAGV